MLSVKILHIFWFKFFSPIFKILFFCVSLCEFYKICKDTLHVPYSWKKCLSYNFSSTNCQFFSHWILTNRKRKGLLTDISSVHESHVCKVLVCAAGQQGNALGEMLSQSICIFKRSSVLCYGGQEPSRNRVVVPARQSPHL